MHQFKAAFFDMDGLLLDSESLAFDAFLSTCKIFELGDLSDLFFRLVGTNSTLGDVILEQGLKGVSDFKQFNLKWDSEYKKLTEGKPIPLKAGVAELLHHLESIGTPMAVATSTNTESAKSKLEASGVLSYFEFVVGGDEVENSKPVPDAYLKAASKMFLRPEGCLAFEDSANGVRSAVSAGMNVVQIPDLVQPDSELLKLGHVVLGSLADVLRFDFESQSG